MTMAHPDEQDEMVDMDDDNTRSSESEETKRVASSTVPDEQRAANPNIINK